LREGFCALTNGLRPCPDAATRELEPPEGVKCIVYTDGSCLNNGDEDAVAGSGVWFGPDNPAI